MPFPVDKKYIDDTEKELGLIFPSTFVQKMTEENGGEIATDDDDWELFPFFDKSDKKRISRTCNHIALETKNAREWESFPTNAIAIGQNGSGDFLILQTNSSDNNQLLDAIFIWRHDSDDIEKVANSILDLNS
jgi:hypothetical protein